MTHECPMCGTGRAVFYVCKSCKVLLDREIGAGWERTDWFKAIQQSHNRLLKAEGRERAILIKLNDGGSLEAPMTSYERAVKLIREGTLDAADLERRLSHGKRRVNKQHLRKTISRALADLADEIDLITANRAEEWGELVEA